MKTQNGIIRHTHFILFIILLGIFTLAFIGCGDGGGGGDGNEENYTTAEVIIGPDGGEYHLANDIVLRVPEGAVNEETVFKFRLVEEEEVMPVLNSYGLTEKYFMAAFEVEPYNFKFNKPIDIILPVETPLDSTDLPYLFRVNKAEGIYTASTSNSKSVSSASFYDIQESVWQQYLKFDCKANTVSLINIEELAYEPSYVLAQIKAIIDHSGCIEDTCRCCRFEVIEEASDHIADGECFNSTIDGSIKFIDCEDKPIEKWNMEERSIGSIEFIPPTVRIKVGEAASVATILKDTEGNLLADYSLKAVVSSNPLWADIVSFGKDFFIVKGESVGQTVITADFGCDIKDQVTVVVEETSFVVDTDPVTVPEGGTAVFHVKLSDPPPELSPVTATVTLSGDIDISIQSGENLTFDATNWDVDRPVTLAADEDDDAEDGSATIQIEPDALFVLNSLITANESDNDVLKFVTNADAVTVPENETATFRVKLSTDPVTTVTATVARLSGDTDITVQSGSILTFDSGNWDSFKTVTLAAAPDADYLNGTATIGIRSTGIANKNITANEEEAPEMNATWHMTPLLQYEQCRYVFEGSEWEEQDGFSSFDLRTSQPHGKDSTYIEANYDPITSLVFTGDWDSTSGDFSLSVDTANINECGYLLVATDTCGDAIDCTLVSCQNTTGLSGSTSENLDTLQAESTWYYSVTFSYYQGSGLPLGQNTWECEGTATFQGERQ
jgi:hypothetical protein